MMYQELVPIGGIAINRGVDMFPQNMKNAPQGEVLNVMMENQEDSWQTKLTESKEEMYSMIYQELACIAGMAIDQEGGTLSPNMKNPPQGEVLHIMVGDPEGFLANKVDRIQGRYVPNDIPRA